MSLVQVQLSRRPQCAFVALDKSGSMQGTRLEAAKEGASMILNELQDSDLYGLFAFSDSIEDVSQGIRPIDITTKAQIGARIRSIQANGRTSLYDVVVASLLQVLGTSVQIRQMAGISSSKYALRISCFTTSQISIFVYTLHLLFSFLFPFAHIRRPILMNASHVHRFHRPIGS